MRSPGQLRPACNNLLNDLLITPVTTTNPQL